MVLIKKTCSSQRNNKNIYVQEKKNEVFAEGIKVQKGSRSIDLKGLLGGTTTTEGDEAAEAVVDYKKEFDEQMKSQSESAAELRLPLGPAGPGPKGVPAMLAANEDDHGDLLTCQEYLRDVVIRVRCYQLHMLFYSLHGCSLVTACNLPPSQCSPTIYCLYSLICH